MAQNKKERRSVINILEWLVFTLFSVASWLLLVVASMTTVYFDTEQEADLPRLMKENLPLLVVLCILSLTIAYRGIKYRGVQNRSLSNHRLIKIAIIWCVSICLYLILAVRGLAVNDAGTLNIIVEQFMKGDYSALQPGGYLYVYPFQISYVAIGQLLHILFGASNFVVYQLLNTVSIALTIWGLYRITWELFEDAVTCEIMAILSFGCIYLYIYSTLVYNDIWSIAPQVFALYFTIRYVKGHKIKYIAVGLLCNSAAIVLKSNAYISFVAIAIVLLIDGYQKGTGKKMWKQLAGRLMLIIAGFILTKAMMGSINSAYAHAAGIGHMPDGVPSATYFAMAVHGNSGGGEWGWYDGYNVQTFAANGYDHDATVAAATEELKSTWKLMAQNPRHTIRLFLHKFIVQWSDESLMAMRNFELTARHVEGQPEIIQWIIFGTGRTILRWIMDVYQELILLGVTIYTVVMLHKAHNKEWLPLEQGLIVLFIFGGMVFHEIWEGQGRYVLRYTVCFLPFASYGITRLFRKVNSFQKAK